MRACLAIPLLLLACAPSAPPPTDDTDTDVPCVPVDEVPYDGIDQDCDGQDLTDVDADGFDAEVVGGDDCDDTEPSRHPGAREVPYDGIDQDCDGQDLTDADSDGFDALEVGGTDCDDRNAAISPAATEVCNALDDNCDDRVDDLIVGTLDPTIQGTLDLACDGHAVLVPEGTWHENLLFPADRTVDLEGLDRDPERAVIDASGCAVPPCAGMRMDRIGMSKDDIRVAHLTITGADGGGLVANDSYVTVQDVVFRDNHGQGGLVASRRYSSSRGWVAILDSTFQDNSSARDGGGLYLGDRDLGEVRRCVFRDNSAEGTGGGAEVYPGDPVTDTRFEGNHAGGRTGGGLVIHLDADLSTIDGNVFTGNTAATCASLAYSHASTGILPDTNRFLDGFEGHVGACY